MTDHDDYRKLREEAEDTVNVLRAVYPVLRTQDYFQKGVLRALSVCIKLLVRLNSK